MVCGAHERPPGRMWGLDSGFGIRSPDFVHPDARKLALECVSTADMGDACHRRASPPPPVCAAYESATTTPVSGLRVRASSRWRPVELRTGRLEQPAGGSRRQQELGSGGGAGQGGRALAGGRGCRVVRELIREQVEGRH